MSAADTYAARVDAVLAQRTRLRGPQPAGDLFGGLPPDHPLLTSNPRREPEPNLAVVMTYVEPDDIVVDVGGGAGRYSLPIALHCREVINVDPSAAMLTAYETHAQRAGITNARAVHADWLDAEPPRGTFALVNHVTYLTRDIVRFIEKLEQAGSRRVLITVGSPPPPARNGKLFQMVQGEPSESVPGHVELVNVLWEMGIEPDVRMLPEPTVQVAPVPTREAAVESVVGGTRGHQWAFWPLAPDVEARARKLAEDRFDDLFTKVPDGYLQTWTGPARDVLITWEPRR